MTDKAASLVWDKVPRPFGETFSVSGAASGPGGNPKRFPGQLHDPETGFHYKYFRDCAPAMAAGASDRRSEISGIVKLIEAAGTRHLQKTRSCVIDQKSH
jgi:hypothetical protein